MLVEYYHSMRPAQDEPIIERDRTISGFCERPRNHGSIRKKITIFTEWKRDREREMRRERERERELDKMRSVLAKLVR